MKPEIEELIKGMKDDLLQVRTQFTILRHEQPQLDPATNDLSANVNETIDELWEHITLLEQSLRTKPV